MHLLSVVVFSQKPDTARLTAAALSRFGGVHLHAADSFECLGESPCRFFVHSVNRLDQLTVPRSVLILADQSAPRRLRLGEDVIVVAGSGSRKAHRLLGGYPNTVVTCGTGPHDSLTLSSSDNGRIMLCAQRSLPTVQGVWTEPFEFAVQSDRCGIRTAALIGATAAVCGCDLTVGCLTI